MNENVLSHNNSGFPVTDIEGNFAEVITLLVMEFGGFQKLGKFLDSISGKISKEDLSEYLKIRASIRLLKNIADKNQEGFEALQEEITEKQKLTINEYVFAILDERAKYPEKTMAWLYNPETMPKELKQAHQNLDRAIEEIYRMGNPFTSDAERLEHLFKRYDEMTKKDTLFAKQKKTRKKTKI